MKRIFNYIIAKTKGENFELDNNMPRGYILFFK